VIRIAEKRQVVQNQRTQLTIALHNQFQSLDMLRVRLKAAEVLRENYLSGQKLNSSQLYQKLYFDENRQDDWLCVSALLHFYEEVGKLRKQGKVDENLTRIFFERYLREMYEKEFLGHLASISTSSNWASSVTDLANWLDIPTNPKVTTQKTVSDNGKPKPSSMGRRQDRTKKKQRS
jgi:hypothetical protein